VAHGRPRPNRRASCTRRLLLPLGLPHRRGGRAVECAGLENRFGSFGPTRVRIPPSPLAVRSGHFFPTVYLRIARRHWRFRLRLPRDFPTATPLSIPGRARPGPDHYAGSKTGASRHHSIATTTRYPVITGSLHMRTIAGQAPRGVLWGLTSTQLPQVLPVRDVLARHAQPTSPQDRRTARHARVARRSLPRGTPTLSEQIGAQLNAQVLPPGPLATRGFRRRMSANVREERGAQSDPAASGYSQAALLGRTGGARRRAC
jgi:hypothetical protein